MKQKGELKESERKCFSNKVLSEKLQNIFLYSHCVGSGQVGPTLMLFGQSETNFQVRKFFLLNEDHKEAQNYIVREKISSKDGINRNTGKTKYSLIYKRFILGVESKKTIYSNNQGKLIDKSWDKISLYLS